MKKKKHIAAIIFMAAAIAGSIPLGVNRTLNRMRDDLDGIYYYDQAGYSIDDGIEKRRAAANDLITLAGRYQDKNPELEGLIDALDYRVRASENAGFDEDTFEMEAQANFALDAPAQALADALKQSDLSEKDAKYPDQLIKQMESEQDKISRSSYNDEARAFNAKLAELAPMALVKPMATFDVPSGNVEYSEAMGDGDMIEQDDVAQGGGTEVVESDAAISQWADAYADRVAGQAEEYADSVAGRVEEYADAVPSQAGNWADSLADRIGNTIDRVLG